MRVTAHGFGSPRNGMAEQKFYRSWRGKPLPVAPPPPAERPRNRWTPGARQERLDALARMRVNDTPGHPQDGALTCAQAAAMFGVTARTIMRDLRTLREAS